MGAVKDARQDVAKAKAHLTEVAGQVDLVAPLRQHPLLTVAGACAIGAWAANDTRTLADILAVARAVGPWLIKAEKLKS
jgi:hypothetical protein